MPATAASSSPASRATASTSCAPGCGCRRKSPRPTGCCSKPPSSPPRCCARSPAASPISCWWSRRRSGWRFPPCFCAAGGGCPYVFDVEDLQPDSAGDLGMLPRPRAAGALPSGSPGLPQRGAGLNRHGRHAAANPRQAGSRGKSHRHPSARRPAAASPCGHRDRRGSVFRQQAPARRKIPGRALRQHGSEAGPRRRARGRASVCAIDPGLAFLLAGDGAMRPQLEARARALGLDNVRFLPLLESAAVLRVAGRHRPGAHRATGHRLRYRLSFEDSHPALRRPPHRRRGHAGSEIGRVLRSRKAAWLPNRSSRRTGRDHRACFAIPRNAPPWAPAAAAMPASTGTNHGLLPRFAAHLLRCVTPAPLAT